ncbi:MAG: hypothetical protein LBN29_12030 [Mediterranea sp.]|jgi:hypothetical protein|nr:hypothetical protein [Mediterranea sp.]
MIGFIVKSKNGICRVGIPVESVVDMVANVLAYRQNWILGGMERSGEKHFAWPGGDLEVGDEFEIEIAEFDEASEPIDQTGWTPPVIDEAEILEGQLIRYRELKRVLTAEGFLKEESL